MRLPSETVERRLRHEVRFVNDMNDEPIDGIRAVLVSPRRPGWTLTRSGHRLIVSVVDRHDDSSVVPRVRVEVVDPVAKARLKPFGAPPGATRPELYHRRTLDLVAEVTTVRLVPAPAAIELSLVDRTGAPRGGLGVRLHGSGGETLILHEGPPAIYRASNVTWTSSFLRCSVSIDMAMHERTISIDPTKRTTRVRLVHA